LIPALRLRDDWANLILALKNVIDISEEDVTSILHDVIRAHGGVRPHADAMEVDVPPSSTVPSLENTLPLCVVYPTSGPALRLAIRSSLREATELDRILEVFLVWIDRWCSEPELLLLDKVEKDSHGVSIVSQGQKTLDGIPPLDKILSFFQAVLDSSFLSLLSHSPSQRLLLQIFESLKPEVDFNNDLDILRGPLEPFAKAQKKALADASQGLQKIDQSIDWRRRRKAAHEQASISIGLYQVEELVL